MLQYMFSICDILSFEERERDKIHSDHSISFPQVVKIYNYRLTRKFMARKPTKFTIDYLNIKDTNEFIIKVYKLVQKKVNNISVLEKFNSSQR